MGPLTRLWQWQRRRLGSKATGKDASVWLSNFDSCGTQRRLQYQQYLDVLKIVRDRYMPSTVIYSHGMVV